VLLLTALGMQSWRLANEQAAHSATIRDHAVALAAAVQDARTKEQAYAARISEAVHQQAQRAVVAEADAVRAAGAVDRLRERAKASAGRVSNDPASAARSEADRIANALATLADAGGLVAKSADDAINRGVTCEASHPVTR